MNVEMQLRKQMESLSTGNALGVFTIATTPPVIKCADPS
jgi:hypothetical protein